MPDLSEDLEKVGGEAIRNKNFLRCRNYGKIGKMACKTKNTDP
jgi:hypothetical protein